jgi:hypothetical protein
MRFYPKIFVFILIVLAGFACSTAPKRTLTPLETLKEYGDAFQKKDITTMKLLLSSESLKMHEQEAKAQNTTVDEIVKRETLFSENQKTAEFRNQKIEDDTATIEMKDSAGIWNTVQFVKEDGIWKIDRKGFANKIEQEVEQKNNELDNIINQGRIDNSNVIVNSNTINNSNTIVNSNTVNNSNSINNVNTRP